MSTPSRSSNDLLADLGIPARANSLAELALTHRSLAGDAATQPAHNERLEFLGDAVLGTVIADILYSDYPDLTEGEMTRSRAAVVGMPGLAEVARNLGIGEHLRMSKGEEMTGGREKDSILADTLEALFGALYLERGIEAARTAVRSIFGVSIEEAVGGEGSNHKGRLQEEVVRRLATRPRYDVSSSGPEHDKRFEATVYVDGEVCGRGEGRSKKDAEQHAAREALERLDDFVAPRIALGAEPQEVGEHGARAS